MGLFNRRDRVAELEAELEALKAQMNVQAPAFLREGVSPFQDLPGLTLPDRQAELYQRLSWVYTAVSITARTAASAAFNVMRLIGEKTEQIDNHPFEERLRNPNPLQSRTEFLESVFGFRQLTGNAYIWLNRATPTAPPSELWVIPPHNIEPVPDKRLYLKGYMYDGGNGRRVPLETWEICHLKLFHPRNAFVGLSPIEALATAATGDLAMSKWNTNFFDKQNAKPAGALAFADRINDGDWERMQLEIKQQHGGTQRRMMLLRNAGTGGVSWVQFGVNQKDMEFLQARTFNKEEIFAALAPGLASMLSVNATEANSSAGRATFAETTIWPMHQAVAEKFTRDILPAYGDKLVGEFEDVRSTDRTIELEEQKTAFSVLTLAEVREKYYNLGPLGDERDNQIVASGKGVPQDVPPQLAAFQANTPPQPSSPPEPTPSEPPEPDEDDTAAKALHDDLVRWQRKAYKRTKAGREASVPFESEHIPDSLNAAIRGALEAVETPTGARALFSAVIDSPLDWQGYP